MRKVLFTTICFLVAAFAPGANAALVTSFSQNPAAAPTVTATDNGTVTTISINSASDNVTAGLTGLFPNAFFSMTATSFDAATQVGAAIIQHYNGTFCLTTAAGCGGTNILTGVFTDAAFGAGGGPGLVVNVNNPPDTLSLTSAIVAANLLAAPSTFNITFANLGPALHIDGTTIGAFTADFTGNVSASAAVMEPGSLALLGFGLLGLGTIQLRKRN